MKRQQVRLLDGLLRDDGVDEEAAGLLVVQRIVLDVSDDVLGLLALHHGSIHGAGQQRILARVFEGAAVPWAHATRSTPPPSVISKPCALSSSPITVPYAQADPVSQLEAAPRLEGIAVE